MKTKLLMLFWGGMIICSAHGGTTEDKLTTARAGDAGTQYALGLQYMLGEGVAPNPGEAVKWLTQAAIQGHLDAQARLGSLYLGGKGVPKSSGEAAKWFRLAAEQGQAAAQVQMARMHLAGAGVPKEDVEAFKWASLADSQGDKQARPILALLRGRMPGADLAAAEALVRGLLDKKPSSAAIEGVPLTAPPLE